MKYAVILALLFAMGCASKKKEKEATLPEPITTAAPAPTPAPPVVPKDSDSSQKMTCTKDKDVRDLEVVKKGAKGCALNYTKAGKTTEAATSSIGAKHCESSEAKIRGKLEKSGFKCS